MFEWIVGVVEHLSYVGVALLMFLENLFPPIPSELIMPLAGFAAARGDMSLPGVVLAGTAGSVLGALLWYYVGACFGKERLKRVAARHGRWLTLSADEIERAATWFTRHGTKAVLIGRLVPGVRTLISVPAGIASMPLLPFLAWSALGSLVWSGLLAFSGLWLEARYGDVAAYVDPVAKAALGFILAIYLYRLVTHRSDIQSDKD